jgi:hypothetical protein
MLDAFAGLAAELVEADLTLGFGGGKKFDAKGDERDLDLTRPVRARHVRFSELCWSLKRTGEMLIIARNGLKSEGK